MTDQRVHVHVHGALAARRVAERGVPRCGTRRVCCWVPRLCQLRGPGRRQFRCLFSVCVADSLLPRTYCGGDVSMPYAATDEGKKASPAPGHCYYRDDC